MGRKDPPMPLAIRTDSSKSNGVNENYPPQTSGSHESPNTPRYFFGKASKSTEDLHQMQSSAQNNAPYPQTSRMPDMPSHNFEQSSASAHAGQPDGYGHAYNEHEKVPTPPAQNSPQKSGGFFSSFKPGGNKKQNDSKRPGTRDNLQSRDAEHQLNQAATAADLGSEDRSRGDERPVTSDKQNNLSQNKSEPMLNRHLDHGNSKSSRDRAPPGQGHIVTAKRSKPKGLGNILRRTNSTRNDFQSADNNMDDGRQQLSIPGQHQQYYDGGLRTAPIREDQGSRFAGNSSNQLRNRSADRHPYDQPKAEYGRRLKDQHRPAGSLSLPRDASTNSLMTSLKGAATKGATSFGRNFFGKTHTEKSVRDIYGEVKYQTKNLTLPLIEQTRTSRISKQLETSRDKTEYWMPSLPWRCIDYLNYRGIDQEGLYRIPGSNREVELYKERFDTGHDVNLFEQKDLYDINIISTLLKWWIRELPDELFPKESQHRIERERNPDNDDEVPDAMREELSNLPPYNYYLLFALTCHLSLINEHSGSNKMTFHNLSVCFLPCLKLDAWCFRYLVEHWAECWRGCNTETEWLEKERLYELEDHSYNLTGNPRKGSVAAGSEHQRNLSNLSSNSSNLPGSKPQSRKASREDDNLKEGHKHSNSSSCDREREYREPEKPKPTLTAPTIRQIRNEGNNRLQTPPDNYAGRGQDLLSPIQPLSPMHMPGASSS